MNFLFDHQCPQCGAPAVLEETERLFSCEFCGGRSYRRAGQYFRYSFPSNAPSDKSIIYLPYWRFKGITFTCTLEGGIQHRFIDVSHQAVKDHHLPLSVGLRAQALKLKFVAPGAEGRYLVPTISSEQATPLMEARMNMNLPASGKILYRTYVGDIFSMIYSPFYEDDRLHDAVLNKALDSGAHLNGFEDESPKWPIKFIPVLCPHCGWDLDGEKEALVLECRNCQSAWHTTPKGLMKLQFGHLPLAIEDPVYLPFWRIRADISVLQLESYADLVKLGNLPRVVQPGMDDMPFYFWVQAFKVRPQIFLRMARKLTMNQPQDQLVSEFPNARLHPVTLPVMEATESLKIILASIAKPARKILPLIPDIQITPQTFKLVYLPFKESRHELIQPKFHLTVNKNMLALATGL
jgi:hypothetical protein